MNSPLVFVLILTMTTIAAAASTDGIYASENPVRVGSSVTLFSQNSVTTGTWLFDNDLIVIIFPGDPILTNNWRDRVTFNKNTSSLTIRSLLQKDSGLYTLRAVNSFRAQLTLSVQVPVSHVTLTANATNLVEFNDTALLMCSVLNGSSLSYVWLKGSSVVTAGGGVQLSDGGANLTIVGVTRYDEGPFRCNVSNGVSSEMSVPVHLNISYGPSNIAMMIVPMRSTYKTGSSISLACSAESSPPAMIQWMVDGVYLNKFGPLLQLESVTVNNSGNYRCLFHNPVTFRFSSRSAMIRIMEPIVAVVVNHTGGPAIVHEPFILRCEVTGSASSVQWWRNGQLITADNTTVFDMDNKTLILMSVQKSDDGNYQCQAFNSVSNISSSPYTVDVNYGPEKPLIAGQSTALAGTVETLNCSSESNPPSHIRWYFNNSLVATASGLALGPLTLNMSGKYICMAFNNITNKNSSAYTMLTVLAPVTMASIQIVGSQPIQNHTFTLTCETAGNVELIMWMYDWYPLYADNTRNFSMDHAILTFDPVMNSDNGDYQCVASNPLSRFSSQIFTLEVFYGPEMPTVTGPNSANTGYNATFSCYASSNPPSSYKWLFNDSVVANTSQFVTPPLTKDMSGMYTCMAYNNVTGKNSSAYTMLTVWAPVTMASIQIVGSQPIQNHTFTLTCETAGSVESIMWMYDWYPLYADNTRNFSMDNATLTFDPVMNSDNGDYQCVASNPLSHLSSQIFTLEVFYGPEMPTITGPNSANTGYNATFSCYASSNPPSSYKWLFNDSVVANTSQFVTPPLTKDMNGMYTCMAYNNVTGKNSSAYRMLTVWAPVTMASIQIVGAQPIQNHTFTLTCETAGNVESIMWMYDSYPLYADNTRNFSMDNATLTFDPVMNSDNGNYQCVASNSFSSLSSQIFTLEVFYPIASVRVETTMNPAIEGHFYELTCSVSGPAGHIYWMKNGEQLHEDNRTVFNMDNKTVTFNPLEQNDTGHYQCMAINPFWNMTSPPYKLLVNFGPETPIIDGQSFAEIGQNAVFHCSAMSVPPSQFSWWFNGSNLSNYSVLTTDPLTFNMSGEYTCMAYNNVTGRKSTNSKMLTVIEKVRSMITNDTVPINSENFTLTCDVTGPYDTIYWMKNNMRLNMTNSTEDHHMSYHFGNNTLHFTPVTIYNDGVYQCVATYQAGLHKSPPYMLLVNYGPLSVKISGPYYTRSGVHVSFICSADSRPDCVFNWFLNNSLVAVRNGSLITFPATKENEGNYMCKARNPVTNITMYETKAFTLAAHASALNLPSRGGLMLMGLFALSVSVLFN